MTEQTKAPRRFIAWHGTTLEGYRAINRSGFFKDGTYFARHLEAALKFGGEYVFAVEFEDDERMWRYPEARQDWQFRVATDYSNGHIVRITHYTTTPIFEDKDLEREVFESNPP